MQVIVTFLILGDALGVSSAIWKEEAPLSSPKQIMHFTNTLEHALILLKCMVNEHVFMNLVSLGKSFNLH